MLISVRYSILIDLIRKGRTSTKTIIEIFRCVLTGSTLMKYKLQYLKYNNFYEVLNVKKG